LREELRHDSFALNLVNRLRALTTYIQYDWRIAFLTLPGAPWNVLDSSLKSNAPRPGYTRAFRGPDLDRRLEYRVDGNGTRCRSI
jgi:hypothetical protein